MLAIVTIIKGELNGKEKLREQLADMSIEARESADTYIYKPKAGLLMEFLLKLKAGKVPYRTHFDALEGLPDEDVET